MNTEDEILEPAMRRWILSEAVPHVWAAAFVANLANGEELALRIADAAAAALERIKRAPLKPLESKGSIYRCSNMQLFTSLKSLR